MVSVFINFLQLFGDIPEADRQLIEAAMHSRALKEGDVLLEEGRVCKELFFICRGILRIVKLNDKGNQVTYFFLKENQFCCILDSFNNKVPAEEGIQAACDSEVLTISRAALDGLYEKLPYLKKLITGIITQGLLDKIALRNSYLGEDSTSRYLKFMTRQPEVALRVSLTDVASYLGITPQSLSRIRKSIR
ncbi:Crp/Fnr family transcriptional regulator [Mucilaginibacter gynuensis]|uniref:Crp/Fnr family transcriptional regulator n=1 Tax=Mucilaginibacter gynuensis TaxID=1302236 RepID=A0ABP8G2V7_9SPHI